jgi:hypothetical protein
MQMQMGGMSGMGDVGVGGGAPVGMNMNMNMGMGMSAAAVSGGYLQQAQQQQQQQIQMGGVGMSEGEIDQGEPADDSQNGLAPQDEPPQTEEDRLREREIERARLALQQHQQQAQMHAQMHNDRFVCAFVRSCLLVSFSSSLVFLSSRILAHTCDPIFSCMPSSSTAYVVGSFRWDPNAAPQGGAYGDSYGASGDFHDNM